jgi:Carboxypeptidase regulatory-like domain
MCACFAQLSSGRISGTVTDTSGAVIPGASITVTNQATELSWKVTSDSKGFYMVTNLPSGAYNVNAEAMGFRKAEQAGYDLVDAGNITADFKLEIGAVTESVVVREVLGETVNTVSGEVGRTIDSEQVQDLALNGRNYMQLVSLVPGVALLNEDQMALTTSLSTTSQSVNGNRGDSNHLMVDGGMNMDSGSNGSQINNVGVDFISELRVQTSGFSAEYGRNSGASINVVTKSGGDRFHGGVLYTIRNDYLDAKDYFAPQKPELRFNDFGWNLGGPVKFGPIARGRLFFFAGQEWKKIRRFTSPTRRTLPTRAERAGDFSDRKSANIYYPGTKTPIPNKDLSSLMTADGRAIMKVYDAMEPYAASYLDTPTSNNTVFQVLNPFNWRQDIARVDYKASDRNFVYFRYIHDNYDTIDPLGTFNASQLPTTPTLRNRPGYGPQLADIWTVSPRVVNEAKINTSWNSQRTPLQGDNWLRSTYGFQFPLVYGGLGPYGGGIPDVTISSFASFNGPARVYLMSPVTDISVFDNLTYLRNEHTIKTGFSLVRNRKDQNGRAVYDGSVAFNTSANSGTTNYALADAALGQFQKYTEASSDPVGFFRFSEYNAFVQDSWKVTRRFSVEIGVRFSRFLPTYTTANNIENFVPALYNPANAVTVNPLGIIVPGSGYPYNGLVRAGDGVPQDQLGRVPGGAAAEVLSVPAGAPRGFYPPANLWMPRFSFAWAPFSNSRTALRGGFGSFHDRSQGNVIFSQTNIPPYSGQAAYENGNLANPSGGTAAALAPIGNIQAIDPNLKVPVVYSYNLGVQRELGRGIFLDLTYAGNLGRHLLRRPDINYPSFAALVKNYAIPSAQRPVVNSIRPYTGYSAIQMFLSDANSNYNSLQGYLTKRKGNINFTVSYTWSHALTDSSSYNSNPDSGVEWTNRHFNYGPADFDRRHIFVVTYTYRLPLLRKRHGFAGTAFGKWEISGVTRAQAGPPVTPDGSSTGVTRRADYLGGVVSLPSDQRTPDHWFNTAAFKAAPYDRLGNAGVGIIRAPGLYLWDISLRKSFPIRESWRLQFQADSFNLANHPNFRSLSNTTTDSDFGSFSACGPARNIQFGLKLNF